jgi:hypothetical protein
MNMPSARITLVHMLPDGQEATLEDDYNLEFYGIENRSCLYMRPDQFARRMSDCTSDFLHGFH